MHPKKKAADCMLDRFKLSKRERDILPLVCRGLSNPQIAERLFISDKTVKGHMKNIFKKTGAGSRSRLISLFLEPALQTQKRPILLVEDDPNDIALTLWTLEKSNIMNEIVVISDGAKALEYLFCEGEYSQRDTSIMPQLILLDLKLPGMSGIEVLKKIRLEEKTKLLPVIILTSSDNERYIIESYALEIKGWLCKPLVISKFAEVVNRLGLSWIVINETADLP